MLKESKLGRALVEAKRRGMRVDPDGSVIGMRGKPLSCSKRGQKYDMFSVILEGERVTVAVHKLQAYQKFGDLIFSETTQGVHIRHLNGNAKDNSWDNIEIGTPRDNRMDIPKKTRQEAAQKAANARKKFTDEDILDILAKKNAGLSLGKLSKEYGTSKGNISDIVNRKLYKTISTEGVDLDARYKELNDKLLSSNNENGDVAPP